MKISDVESARAAQIPAVSPAQPVTPNSDPRPDFQDAGGNPAAKVELSPEGQALAVARQAVDAAPDTRDDLVARLKAQIDAGTYHVSSSDIADRMIRRTT
jgi:flagellar biosynthesis anti-sigma factor FlgM